MQVLLYLCMVKILYVHILEHNMKFIINLFQIILDDHTSPKMVIPNVTMCAVVLLRKKALQRFVLDDTHSNYHSLVRFWSVWLMVWSANHNLHCDIVNVNLCFFVCAFVVYLVIQVNLFELCILCHTVDSRFLHFQWVPINFQFSVVLYDAPLSMWSCFLQIEYVWPLWPLVVTFWWPLVTCDLVVALTLEHVSYHRQSRCWLRGILKRTMICLEFL